MVINSDFDITVLVIRAANRLWNAPTETPIRRKLRKHWAVALKHTGRTWYFSNGQKILSDSLHPVILPGGSSYSWTCEEAGECLMIEFEAPQQLQAVFSFAVTDSSFA